EFRDDGGGNARGRDYAGPDGDVVARDACFGDRRQFGKGSRARRPGHGEAAQPARFDQRRYRSQVVENQVHLIFDNLTSITSLVKAGRLRGLAVTGTTRAGPFPELPTIAEAGVPGYDVTVWTGVIAPAGVPSAIVAKLNAE